MELIETRHASDLYRDHAIALTRFATVLVGPDDAADVVADAVESLLASGRLVNADYPRALLYRAVLTKARSMQRRPPRGMNGKQPVEAWFGAAADTSGPIGSSRDRRGRRAASRARPFFQSADRT